MSRHVLHHIQEARLKQRKLLAVLIDPDCASEEQLIHLVEQARKGPADLIFVGGSLLLRDALDQCVASIQDHCDIPVVLFPGSVMQLSPRADALLFLSLISGRNPEFLIGHQVVAAPYLRQMDLEVMSTGYMLIESGKPTTASYMSGTDPIPHQKPEIAASTAMAGELLGMKLIYMDGGSGAEIPISETMIRQVRASVDIPIIVGGGINSAEKAQSNCQAGADVIVVGNALETDPHLLQEIAQAIHEE